MWDFVPFRGRADDTFSISNLRSPRLHDGLRYLGGPVWQLGFGSNVQVVRAQDLGWFRVRGFRGPFSVAVVGFCAGVNVLR